MTIKNTGFDGTIDEVEFASIVRSSGVKSSFSSVNAYKVSAVGDGTRRVKILPGRAYAAGVIQVSDETQYVTIPAPASAGWFLVVLRRNWSNNTITPTVLTGATQTSTTPTVCPAKPVGFTQDVGTIWDQELAWVFSTLGSTSYTVVDLRPQMLGVPAEGDAGSRDDYYGIPTSFAARMQLQGAEWKRTDAGWTERYYAEKNTTYNGNNGAVEAGWYPVDGKMPIAKLTRTSKGDIGTANAGASLFNWDGWEIRHGSFGHSGGIVSIPIGGLWELIPSIEFEAHVDTKRRQVRLYKGSGVIQTVTIAGNETSGQSAVVRAHWTGVLLSTDTFHADAAQGSGTPLNIGGNDGTFFLLRYLGPA